MDSYFKVLRETLAQLQRIRAEITDPCDRTCVEDHIKLIETNLRRGEDWEAKQERVRIHAQVMEEANGQI